MVDIHRSEEETVEAIKKWWKENGTAVITGVVIGIALIVGVRYWWTYQERHAQESAQIYSQLLQAQNQGNAEQMGAHARTLKQDYDGTPYATFASFILAEDALQQDDTDQAIAEYRWALEHAPHAAMEHLARVRLARLLIDAEQYDEASELIGTEAHASFTAQYEELRGDIYEAKGEIESARAAYQAALAAAGRTHRNIIEMKLHSLPRSAQPEESGDTSEASS